jgi:acetyl-CoA C-acetyltransferase
VTATTRDKLDDRTPVLVGVGQLSQRVDRGAPELEPVDLMVEALRTALDDAGAPGLAASIDSIRVLNLLSWSYRDPGALVGERIGATPRHTALTVMGGNYSQTLVNGAAVDIAAGRAEVVVVCGAESWRSRGAARKSGSTPPWTVQADDVVPSQIYGKDDGDLSSPIEIARGVFMPVQVYPMFDVALRAHLGLGIDEHRQRIAGLWSRFSEVAATNPHAWIQQRYTPDEVAAPTPQNRMVGFPYTKVMNSNNNVEQGAALVLCSVGAARAAGVPSDRWVFLHAGSDAHDHWFVSDRDDLHSSPAIRTAGRRALELAGVGVDDLAHVDLYSCFPSAVQIAAAELGLGLDRQLTVTGGMSFAGGPWNNYVTHSIATMADVVRADPGSIGLVSANGGYLTKHAFGVYSTRPPTAGFRWENCQASVDALPRRASVLDHAGPATLESCTVMHGRDGAELALAAVLTPAGERTWARSDDPTVMTSLMEREWVGEAVHIEDGGTLKL